jgi:hypothetical protein
MPDFNFGHLVWEEIGAIYITLKRFSMNTDMDMVVMDSADYKKRGPRHLYEKFTSFFLPVITRESVRHTTTYLESFGKEYVCFKRLLVPSFSRLFLHYTDSFHEGKEPLFFQFRNDILSYYSLNPFSKPKRHRILLNSKKESYNFGRSGNRTRFRSIANEQEVYQFLLSRYKNVQVDMINMATLSLKDQLKEMLETTILITPCGGVSMILPFLPIDSYAIIMDYPGGEKPFFFKYDEGDSATMEASFWNLWTHVNKMYYQVFTEEDYVWDVPEGKSYRDDTSVVVNLDRIEFMVNEALHHYDV